MLAVYLGVLLLIAWRAARRTHGGVDFHLAGRSLGAWAAGISSTASSESGWVTLGAVGMTYAFGVSGLWYAPGCLPIHVRVASKNQKQMIPIYTSRRDSVNQN